MGNGRTHITIAMVIVAGFVILGKGWLSSIANKVRSASGVPTK